MLLLWCRGVLNRIFTFQGWMLFWVGLATAFYATIMVRSAVTVLFLVIGGLFLVNGIMLLLLLPRLKITRKVPESVMQGKVFTVEYEVENLSFFPCFSLLADPLLFNNDILKGEKPEFFSLRGKGKFTFQRRFRIEKRGVWELPAATVETAFPFGLLKASFCNHRKQAISVHCVWQKWENFSMESLGNEQSGSIKPHAVKRSFQRGMDLASCRKYVYGDEIRFIHWGNSAKWGHLVVKEFEEEKSIHAAIVVDSFVKYSPEDLRKDAGNILRLRSFSFGDDGKRLESILSFAASFAASFCVEENSLDFFIPEMIPINSGKSFSLQMGEWKNFCRKWILGKDGRKKECRIKECTIGNKYMPLPAFLNILAAVKKVEQKERFAGFTLDMLRKLKESSFVLLILQSYDKEAENFCRKLSKLGIFCRVLLVTEEEEDSDKEKNGEKGAFGVEKIRCKNLLEGKWMKRGRR